MTSRQPPTSPLTRVMVDENTDLPALIRDTRARLSQTYREAAQEIGISPGYLHEISFGLKEPGWSIVRKLLAWINSSTPSPSPTPSTHTPDREAP